MWVPAALVFTAWLYWLNHMLTARRTVAIVVARYYEPVVWMRDVARQYPDIQFFLYLKGPDLTADEWTQLPPHRVVVRRLPNVGRCDHTFLYHIVNHYDDLQGVTVFACGDGADTRKGGLIQHVIRSAVVTHDTVLHGSIVDNVAQQDHHFQLDRWLSTNTVNRVDAGGDDQLQPAPLRPFGVWYANEFPELATVPIRVICWKSIFAVHRRHVRQHPVARYQHLLAQVEQHSNPEVGHYIERSWGAIFYPYPDSCLDGY